MATSTALDLRLGSSGPPVLRGGEALARPRLFVTVVPAGGQKSDARLFLVSRIDGARVARFGARGGSVEARETLLCMPVQAADPRIGARLWERGERAGDVVIDGVADAHGRPQRISLLYLDLSRGLSPGDEVTLSLELRRAVAATAGTLEGDSWRRAAETLDPARHLREARLDAGRNVFTLEGAQLAVMTLDEEARRQAADPALNPMSDFRFRDDAALLDEVAIGERVLTTARPDLKSDDGMIGTAATRLPALANALRTGDLAEAERRHGQIRWTLDAARLATDASVKARRPADDANRALLSGRAASGLFFRDLFAKDGIVDTLMRRAREPGCDGARQEILAALARRPDGRALADIAAAPLNLRRKTVVRVETLDRALQAKDMARRLPVLAVDESVILDGEAFKAALDRGWARRPMEMRRLLERTLVTAETLERMDAVGCRDPRVRLAAASLRNGAEALDARGRERASPGHVRHRSATKDGEAR